MPPQHSFYRRSVLSYLRTRIALIALALLSCAFPLAAQAWPPHIRQAREYARARLEAMLLAAYLGGRGVRDRRLKRAEKRLLDPMIRRSDNAAGGGHASGKETLRAVAKRLLRGL